MHRAHTRFAASLAIVVALGTGAFAAAPAHAASVTLVDRAYSVDGSGATASDPLAIGTGGRLTITLTDLNWPQALADLSFSLQTVTGDVLATFSGAGTRTVDVSGGATLYALSYGKAATGALPFGSYGLRIDFLAGSAAVVPLPAAAVLLLSGLGLLGAGGRRRCNQNVRQTH